MKHTDFYNLHKQIDERTREELKAAIKAHGNEYVFIHIDDDGDYDEEERDNAPVISAATIHMGSYEDFYITRVAIEENDSLAIYGYMTEWRADEHEITNVAHGHLEYIIDHIPETDDVQDGNYSADTPSRSPLEKGENCIVRRVAVFFRGLDN